MDLWPAIDIKDGRCVRLYQGDFASETAYGDPVEVACHYLEGGAERLHVVDLDAARSGEPVNRETILRIVRRTGLLVQAGGGVRDKAGAAALLENGVARVVVGTAALAGDRSTLAELVAAWPGRVAIGLDYRSSRGKDGTARRELAVRGWTESTGLLLEEALEWLATQPVAGIVATDIRRDGTGAGPDVVTYQELLEKTDRPVIASGGVGSAADIARLERLSAGGRKLSGVIVGKALVSGSLRLADARQASLGLTR